MRSDVPKVELRRSRLDRIWAPWRLEYIKSTQEPDTGCFLCEAAGIGVDRERLVVYYSDRVISVLNLYPYNNGHLLVAPTRHIGELKDLSRDESVELFETLRRATTWLEEAYQPHGFNVGMNLGRVAGAGLPGHLHIHIVPRWNGDMNFMPIVGETKVMSESLEAGWERLREVIERGK
jgi:ATP adenylyltransferase